MQYINPALIPEYDPEKTFLGQLLGFRQKEGQANLAQNQAGYYDALKQLEAAKLPYASDMAKAAYEHELLKNFWKQQQGLKEKAHADFLPGDYASKRSLRGAQAGAANASAALSHTKRAGQEGTNAWNEALRGNPIFQTKTIAGRISPDALMAISGQAIKGNSPLQMSPVDLQGRPLQALTTTPQITGTQQSKSPMSGGIPYALPEQRAPEENLLSDSIGITQNIPNANVGHQQKSIYEQAYPQLEGAINNKLDKANLATPGSAQKLQFLDNIKHTIRGIDPSVIKSYTGAEGKAQMNRDRAAAIMGSATPEYVQWQRFVNTQARLLAGQIRQFYGDSITPEMDRKIETTFNQDSMLRSPESAIASMAEILRVVNDEGKTYAKSAGELAGSARSGGGFGKQWDSTLKEREQEIEGMQNRVHPSETKNANKENKSLPKENSPKKKEAIKKQLTEDFIQQEMLNTGYDRDEIIDMYQRYGEIL